MYYVLLFYVFYYYNYSGLVLNLLVIRRCGAVIYLLRCLLIFKVELKFGSVANLDV